MVVGRQKENRNTVDL